MSKISKILMISVLAVFLAVGSVMAYPFTELEGYVNPGDSAAWIDNSDGTTTIIGVTYQFNVVEAFGTAKVNFLSLEFEGNVFTNVANFTNVEPGDWYISSITSGTGNLYEMSTAGTTLGAGESLILMADVTLYTAALSDSSYWGEGQVWGQSWLSGDTMLGGDGGSTAPVPEPATMFLLGSGLIGLAGFGRKRLFNKEA